MSEKKHIPEWHIELHNIICNYLKDKEISAPDILAYLILSLVGTVEQNGFDEYFMKLVLDKTLDEFRRKRKARQESENDGMD